MQKIPAKKGTKYPAKTFPAKKIPAKTFPAKKIPAKTFPAKKVQPITLLSEFFNQQLYLD